MGIQALPVKPDNPEGAIDVRAKLQKLEARVERLRQMMALSEPGIAPNATPTRLRLVIKARRTREIMLGTDLFADPAWDMLLESYAADLTDTSLSVTSLCLGAAVPATTALRWLQKLEQQGWVGRRSDPLDGRRIWVEMTTQGSSRMSKYFNAIRPDVLPI